MGRTVPCHLKSRTPRSFSAKEEKVLKRNIQNLHCYVVLFGPQIRKFMWFDFTKNDRVSEFRGNNYIEREKKFHSS